MLPPVTSAPKSRKTTPHSTCSPEWVRISAVRRSSSTAPRTAVPGGGSGSVSSGTQVDVVRALARVHDPGLHAAPQQHAVVRRLAAAARVEGGPVENDPVRSGVEHHRVPLAQRLVVKVKPMCPAHARQPTAASCGARATRRRGRRDWAQRARGRCAPPRGRAPGRAPRRPARARPARPTPTGRRAPTRARRRRDGAAAGRQLPGQVQVQRAERRDADHDPELVHGHDHAARVRRDRHRHPGKHPRHQRAERPRHAAAASTASATYSQPPPVAAGVQQQPGPARPSPLTTNPIIGRPLVVARGQPPPVQADQRERDAARDEGQPGPQRRVAEAVLQLERQAEQPAAEHHHRREQPAEAGDHAGQPEQRPGQDRLPAARAPPGAPPTPSSAKPATEAASSTQPQAGQPSGWPEHERQHEARARPG